MQAKSIGADALRRFFSGMLDKVAPVVPVEEPEPEDEGEPEESPEAWRWEGSSGRV